MVSRDLTRHGGSAQGTKSATWGHRTSDRGKTPNQHVASWGHYRNIFAWPPKIESGSTQLQEATMGLYASHEFAMSCCAMGFLLNRCLSFHVVRVLLISTHVGQRLSLHDI